MAQAPSKDSKIKRGFASMSPERVRAISSKGGKAIVDEQRAFSLRRDLAQEAGRKGGFASGRIRRQLAASPPGAEEEEVGVESLDFDFPQDEPVSEN